MTFQNGQGCPWFHAEATFLLRKNSRPEVCTDVHFWTGYFKRLTESYILRAATGNPQRIRSGTDAAGSMKKQVCDANLQPKNVQGCTFLGEDVRGSTQKRRFVLCTNLVGRTPKDGRGISQKQVFEQNLSSTDVHGRTSVERYTEVHFWTGYFKRLEDGFKKAGGFFERSFHHGRLLLKQACFAGFGDDLIGAENHNNADNRFKESERGGITEVIADKKCASKDVGIQDIGG